MQAVSGHALFGVQVLQKGRRYYARKEDAKSGRAWLLHHEPCLTIMISQQLHLGG